MSYSPLFQVVGVNHRTLAVHDREVLARLEMQSGDLLRGVVDSCKLREAAILSTCNRFEVISVNGAPAIPDDEIVSYLTRKTDRAIAPQSFYSYRGLDAVRHVLRVSSSLDSMVLGETQILGQVKQAYERACDSGVVGKYLHHLFQFTFRVAKRVRGETDIGAGSVSVSYVAVRLAEQIFGTLKDCRVLVLGSGQMAELAALHLRSRGAGLITIANRSLDRAHELARRVSGLAVGLEEVPARIVDADIVIGSLAVDRPFLDARQAPAKFTQQPHFLIDLGMPRNFSEDLGALDNIYLYSIDDLAKIVDENRDLREAAAHDAEVVVDHALVQFDRWLTKVSAEPVLLELRSTVRDIVRSTLGEKLGTGAIGPEKLDAMVHQISQRVAHGLTDLVARSQAGQVDPQALLPLIVEELKLG